MYGDGQAVLHSGSGILDTGTTLILLATGKSTHQLYGLAHVTMRLVRQTHSRGTRNTPGAQEDKDTGLLRIAPAQYANLKSLYFTIGGVSHFELLYLHERLT